MGSAKELSAWLDGTSSASNSPPPHVRCRLLAFGWRARSMPGHVRPAHSRRSGQGGHGVRRRADCQPLGRWEAARCIAWQPGSSPGGWAEKGGWELCGLPSASRRNPSTPRPLRPADLREAQYERDGTGTMYLFRLNRWWVVDATKAVSVCAHARPGRLFFPGGGPGWGLELPGT